MEKNRIRSSFSMIFAVNRSSWLTMDGTELTERHVSQISNAFSYPVTSVSPW